MHLSLDEEIFIIQKQLFVHIGNLEIKCDFHTKRKNIPTNTY